ncbi:MAG: DNA polymerase IV [Gemmatimonadaceae bacterium]|nr:DNA polymerase IV [Gemmatimonadaceae bacterium]
MSTPTPPRRILLADADAFFVAVARLEDPEGAGKASLLIVGGRPGSRGVVCSASYETRKFGVRSGMPISRALRMCPDALCVPVPRDACAERSRAIRAVLDQWSPVVRAASIDEWYLDLSGTESLYREPLAETAAKIRSAVLDATGLSVSFGGGTNKLIAKLAVEYAKPKPGTTATGVHIVEPGAELAFMERVSLAEIPGIGPTFQRKLADRGLETAADVWRHDVGTLTRWYGARAANWLIDRAHGRHDDPVVEREAAKSIGHEDTFGEDINDDARLADEMRRLVTRTAASLRGDGLVARTITVKCKDHDFELRTARKTVKDGVESDRAIADIAVALLERLRAARRVPVRLLGISLSGLTVARGGQLDIFGEPVNATEKSQDRAVSRAMDAVRGKLGREAIQLGRLVR